MRTIELSKQAHKFLKKLPPKQASQVAGRVLELQFDVCPHDAKPLKGFDAWRVDVGEYRIVYEYTQSAVTVYVIGKRNDSDVYRKTQRKLGR